MDALTALIVVAGTVAIAEPLVVFTLTGRAAKRTISATSQRVEEARRQTLAEVAALIQAEREATKALLFGDTYPNEVGGAVGTVVTLVDERLRQVVPSGPTNERGFTSDNAREMAALAVQAREDKRAAEAITESEIVGRVGAVAWEGVQAMFPGLAKKALQFPHLADRILAPLLPHIQAATKAHGQNGSLVTRGGR